MVNYDNLFTLLREKGISKTELAKKVGISSRTLAKLSKGEYVSLKVVEDICSLLKCTPSDILSFVTIEFEGTLLKRLREEKEMQLKGGLYHTTQIKMTFNSNHIEGSTLTEDQTRYIFETNSISSDDNSSINVDDVIETVNHFRAIDYCIDIASEELNEDIIKKLNEILKTGTRDSRKPWFNTGDYKKVPNKVGGKNTTPPNLVKKEINFLLHSYNKLNTVTINDIISFHHDFETIHPFQDGNGRVGRLIAFKECLKHKLTPFIIDDEIKMFYYKGLNEWNNVPDYLLDTCKAGQDKYQAIIDYFR